MSMIESVIKEVFPENSEEYRIIVESYNILNSSTPQIAAEYKNRLMILDKLRTELSSLYFMITRNINQIRNSYQRDYDAQYVRLVKIGRPSHNAIESEIRFNSPDYVTSSLKIEELDNVRNLINSYIRGIDSVKNTTVELLRDSRRID